jgi:hypothetical protein
VVTTAKGFETGDLYPVATLTTRRGGRETAKPAKTGDLNPVAV